MQGGAMLEHFDTDLTVILYRITTLNMHEFNQNGVNMPFISLRIAIEIFLRAFS